MHARRELGIAAVSVQNIVSHQSVDDILGGSTARDALGNERAHDFARKGAELHAPDKSDVAVHHIYRLSAWPRRRRRSWRSSLLPGPLGRETQRARSRAKALPWCRTGTLSSGFNDPWRSSRCLVVRRAQGKVVVGTVPRVTSVHVGEGGEERSGRTRLARGKGQGKPCSVGGLLSEWCAPAVSPASSCASVLEQV